MSDVWIPSTISAVGAVVVVAVQFVLNARSSERLETMRAEVGRVADQRKSLFERRADVLADVYGKLVDAHEGYEAFLGSGTRPANAPGPEESFREAVIKGEDFRKAYTRSRILLPNTLLAKLDRTNAEFETLAKLYFAWRTSGEDEDAALIKVYRKTEGVINATLADLE